MWWCSLPWEQQRGSTQFPHAYKGQLYNFFHDKELLPHQCSLSWRFSFHITVSLRGMLFQVFKILLSLFSWWTALSIYTFGLTLSKWIWTTAACPTSGATYTSFTTLTPAWVWTNYVLANIFYWPLAFPVDSTGADTLARFSSFFFLRLSFLLAPRDHFLDRRNRSATISSIKLYK